MKITTNLLLVSIFVLTATMSFAQEVAGFEKVYYVSPEDAEVDHINYSFKNGVAQSDHCKFAMTIENNSSDIFMFVPKESTFHYDFGDKQPDFKTIVLIPGDKKTKTILVKGSENYLQKVFNYEIGGIYQIPIEGKVAQPEAFQLPAAVNSFNADNFKVQLTKYSASTKEAEAEFEVTYIGNQVGLVDPTSLSVTAKRKKSEETVTYANDDKKAELEILHKNDKIKFKAVFHIPGKIVDMQFATMHINWNNTFTESKAVPMEPVLINFKMDEALTNEKK